MAKAGETRVGSVNGRMVAGGPQARGGSAGPVAVEVLGPLRVRVAGRPVTLTAGRLRTLLAVLAMAAGRVVPVDRLATAVWEEDPPADVRRSLNTYVARLRAVLGGEAIVSRPAGYLLRAERDQIDALRFGRLLDAAAATEPGAQRAALTEALSLWRGEPFEDLPSSWLRSTEAPRLVERYLAAVERRIDLDLTDGQAGDLVAELGQLTGRYPLRESLWTRLLTALDRAGRPAEALTRYETIRARLAEELGTDPCPQLQRIHADLLAGRALPRPPADQPALTPLPAAHAPPATAPPATAKPLPAPTAPLLPAALVPRQLPAPPQVFTGRAPELAALERVHDTASTVAVAAIDGMAGIGKTALAVHVAHRLADRYPDGQLFVDLHGHTQGLPPVDPNDALERVLGALGVPGAQIPAGLEERAALYRSRLARLRLLVVLDNAGSEAQVQPLLPGTPGCLVLVTSRRRLAGLDHTHAVSLDTMPPADAVALFTRAAGAGRVPGGSPELAETVELCGRLPLAIRIAAARLRCHPAWEVQHLLERLRDHRHRLTELAAGQRSVAAALELSYHQLSNDHQRGYRLLGLHPGPDIDTFAAAALVDGTAAQARRLLDQLLEVHLLQEPAPGRCRFHDLTRDHAAGTALRTEPEPEREAAATRLYDHYLGTASAANDLLYPYLADRRPHRAAAGAAAAGPATTGPATTGPATTGPATTGPATTGPATAAVPDPAHATAWLDAELPNLLATAQHAADRRQPDRLVALAVALHEHLRIRGRYVEAEALYRHALTATRATAPASRATAPATRATQPATDHHAGERLALTGLGHFHQLQGRHDLAADDFTRALEIAQDTGHPADQLDPLHGLGRAHRARGWYREAAETYRQVLEIARLAGDQLAEQDAVLGLASLELLQGRYEQAAEHYRQVVEIARATGNRDAEYGATADLGRVHRLQGKHEQAVAEFVRSLEIARSIGHYPGRLNAIVGLGHVYRRQGRHTQAAANYRQVLELAPDGYRNWQLEAWHGLGRLHHDTGHPDRALDCYRRALQLADDLGQRDDQARVHDGLAHSHLALNQCALARRHWQQALDLLRCLGTDYTEDEEATAWAIRGQLANLDRPPAQAVAARRSSTR